MEAWRPVSRLYLPGRGDVGLDQSGGDVGKEQDIGNILKVEPVRFVVGLAQKNQR